MKINKYIFFGSILGLSAMLSTACSDQFLDEPMVSDQTSAYFDTSDGVDALEVAVYESLRHYYGEECSYTMTNYGTDEFEVGGGTDYQYMNDYTGIQPISQKQYFDGLSYWWDAIYIHINNINTLLEKVESVLTSSDSRYNQYKGEGLFLRGFNYFRLVMQYGSVPLKLDTAYADSFTRASEEACFNQIIDDLKAAAGLLPATSADGHITKAAAYHYLAKVYLTRASERFAAITQSDDLQNAVTYGLKVINKEDGTDRELAEDYHDIWNYLEEGCDGASEKSKEIILAAQYTNVDQSKFNRLSNRCHLYYLPKYENKMTGLPRAVEYGRPYQRLRPTEYTYDVFDRVNDSRFWKSFRTLYKSTEGIDDKDEAKQTIGKDKDGNKYIHLRGKTDGLRIIVNNAGDTRYATADGYPGASGPYWWIRYYNDGTPAFSDGGESPNSLKFAGLDKFMDPYRSSVGSSEGVRDGFLARIAETYLIVAEAYGRMGQYGQAVNYINPLRRRAAYREGEDRGHYRNVDLSKHSKLDFFSGNTYYESNNLPESTKSSTLAAMEITEAAFDAAADNGIPYSKFGAASKAEKFIHFILNERTRELCGEFHRWEDLSRTKLLHKRTIPYNTTAAPQLQADAQQKYLLRPIPQTFLDGNMVNGSLMTPEEKAAMQNPGY